MASDDRLEELKQGLYQPGDKSFRLRRSRLSPFGARFDYRWRSADQAIQNPRRFFKSSLPKKLFLLTLAFFLISAAVTIFIFSRGSNLVSAGNVSLEVKGPERIKAGEPLILAVTLVNKNNAPLQFVDLVVEYPAGTRSPDDLIKELSRQREHLGTLPKGEIVSRSFKAVLFGEESQELKIDFSVEYRLADSNAIFDKRVSHSVNIEAAPVEILLGIPGEINSGQEFAIDVEVTANSGNDLNNLALSASYPLGFRFQKATLKPTAGETFWLLGNLKAGAKKGFQIIGILEGQADEQKTFRLAAGAVNPAEPEKIAVVYRNQEETVLIKRPFVSLEATINAEPGEEYVASSRERLRLEVEWRNNLPVAVQDGELRVTFSGPALDPATVSPRNGFYRSAENFAVWDKRTKADFALINPGAGGKASVEFSSVSLLASEFGALRNPTINLEIKFRGRREAEGDEPTQVESVIRKKIKLNSVIQLAAKILYFSGPLKNEGPLPPKVGEPTTYTIVWSMINSSNDLEAGRLIATLPPYVEWVGTQSPTNESLIFTPGEVGGGEVVWDLGTVRGAAGLATPPREVAFQIRFTPSVTQAGAVALLLGEPVLEGIDSFTRAPLSYTFKRPLDTQLSSDPEFKYGQDKVVK